MNLRTLPNVDITYLDEVLLDAAGRMNLLSLADLKRFPHEHLLVWAQKRGRYNLPTRELVAFLRELIGERSAIEIGAGMGDLGLRLGIPMTDSHVQTNPDMVLLYTTLGCLPIQPPPDVEKLDAAAAVRQHRPNAVVASWVTQLFQEGDQNPPKVGSSVHGVDEFDLFEHCRMYIHVGNRDVHHQKRLLRIPHREVEAPFAVSRGFDQSKNVIYIWEKP